MVKIATETMRDSVRSIRENQHRERNVNNLQIELWAINTSLGFDLQKYHGKILMKNMDHLNRKQLFI